MAFTLRVRRVFVLLLCSTVALVGCSASENKPEPTSTSTQAAEEYDLARLSELEDDFPSGLTPEPPSGPSKADSTYAHLVGDTVSYGEPFTVDPPTCRPLFKPVEAQGGAEKMGIGAGGPRPPALVVSAVNPITVPVALPSGGCDRMTFHVEGAIPDGTAERVAAPNIEGAGTYGLKIIYNEGEDFDYIYTAILDGGPYVEVMARMGPDFKAEPLLPDLLNKAVAAIRG